MPKRRKKPSAKRCDDLLKAVKPLAAEIVKLQTQMKAAGMFANHRNLLECPKCDLQEDMTDDGLLFTSLRELPGEDTGERFIRLDDRESWWRGLKCGAEFPCEGFAE